MAQQRQPGPRGLGARVWTKNGGPAGGGSAAASRDEPAPCTRAPTSSSRARPRPGACRGRPSPSSPGAKGLRTNLTQN
eukprot:scaffold910_cov396-Prasinococcus_capsulatus_cf.AAC.23